MSCKESGKKFVVMSEKYHETHLGNKTISRESQDFKRWAASAACVSTVMRLAFCKAATPHTLHRNT